MMNKEKKWILGVCITLILLFQSGNVIAQSLTGNTGLITIPTAEMPRDGGISFGLSGPVERSFIYRGDYYSGVVGSVTLGYLPFLEISARVTRRLDFPEVQALGDRMGSIRLRPFKENALFPSVVLVVNDLVGNRRFNASYLAMSLKTPQNCHQSTYKTLFLRCLGYLCGVFSVLKENITWFRI